MPAPSIEETRTRRDVDRMIDYRRRQRPDDQSDIRVNVERITMHRALHPEIPLAPHIDNTDLPVSCLYRGFRVVSILGEKAVAFQKRQRSGRASP
jgi:hypothetical protein